jgi:hypothetical protein
MEKLAWIFIIFGILLILAASFGANNPSLSPGRVIEATSFQIILAIGGLAAVIVGIIKN